MIVIAIIAIIAAIAIPNLRDARIAANEASAISLLRTYHSAQSVYREQDSDGNGTLDYADDWFTLNQAGLLPDPTVGSTFAQSGYRILKASNPVYKSTMFAWCQLAYPVEIGISGVRFFYINQSGVILYSTNLNIAADDWPPIGK